MAKNVAESFSQLLGNIAHGLQAQCSRVFQNSNNDKVADESSLFMREKQGNLHLLDANASKAKVGKSTSKEELGRSMWTVLHTLAAEFPEKPTKQQKRDARELMAILSRLYPCEECADHLKEILKTNPVEADSGQNFQQWMCHVHNIVNRSLDKPTFPCENLTARWPPSECGEACAVEGRR